MRVAVIIPSFYPALIYGGSTFASYNLTNYASSLNIDIWVSTTNANGRKRLNVKTNEFISLHKFHVKYYHENILNSLSLRLIFGIYNDIKMSDVIHIQSIFSYPTPISLLFSKILSKKVLLSPRGSLALWTFKMNGLLKNIWLKTLINPFIKGIFWHATSLKEKNEILRFFPTANVAIVPDGAIINNRSISYLNRAEMFETFNLKDSQYISCLGRIHPVKGYDLIIKAFPSILKKFPNVKLLIAGQDDGAKKDLQLLIEKYHLEKKILFVGQVSGNLKESFLKHSEVLVMPSHTENFGIVALESLVNGTPVVASKETPWSILHEYKAGFWINNTPSELSSAVISLLGNKSVNWEENSKLLAINYDWQTIAEKYKSLITLILND